MLQILIAERRERHREMINQSRKQRKFQPGDLVIIRKQVQSDATIGRPAKQTFKWKGIYKVLQQEGEKSYLVQKQPTIQGRTRPGRILKYAASVMERIPSSVIIHKHLDTTDTRLSALDQPLVKNPLEQSLGFHQYGKYVKAPAGADFAFDKVEDLWSIDIDSEEEDEDIEPRSPSENLDKETLYEMTKQSMDKLFIIQMKVEPQPRHNWYVVQVDWENTTETKAKQEGIYHLRWMTPHHLDMKRKIRSQCRYWPEVHEVEDDGSLGRMRPISPAKASVEFLERNNWAFYAYDMNLFTDRLVGPFDFTTINKEPHHIHQKVWDELLNMPETNHVNLDTVHQIVPEF
jgi:hypothetical protein